MDQMGAVVPVRSCSAGPVCVGLTAAFALSVSSSFSIRSWKLSLRSLLLAALCISVAVVWGVYRNEDRYVWIEHRCCTSAESNRTNSSGLHGNSIYLQRLCSRVSVCWVLVLAGMWSRLDLKQQGTRLKNVESLDQTDLHS